MNAQNPSVDGSPSIRYFYGSESTVLSRLIYPIFSDGVQQPQLGEIEYDSEATGDLSKARRQLVGPGPTVETNFRTTTGGKVLLTWLPGSGERYQYDPVEKAYYVVLNGDFSVSVDGGVNPGEAPQLMCGLSGVESFEITDDFILRFVPGGPAYAPGFYAPNALYVPRPLVSELVGSANHVETTYVFGLRSSQQALAYSSQPEKAPFYILGPGGGFLDFLPITFASLAYPSDATESFPMAPYAGIAGTVGEAALAFEQQILSPQRTRDIEGFLTQAIVPPSSTGGPKGIEGRTQSSLGMHSGAAPTATGATGATGAPELGCRQAAVGPTGPSATTTRGTLLFAGPTADRWDALRLGQSSHGRQVFEMRGVQGDLRRALLTNQTFLVVSGATKFAQGYDSLQAALSIQGWNFDLCPDKWAEHGTIMIFKFSERSLLDLASDLGSWTSADDYNEAAYSTQNQILGIITDAANQSSPDFDNFNELVNDPGWSGVLILNAFVPLTALPPQLAGLAAGIDPSSFFAHHLGINLSPVAQVGDALQMQDSSLFGLIYYQNTNELVDNGSAYQFKVLFLNVLFANSAITNFSSQIQVFIGQLFGETASLTPPATAGFADDQIDNGHNITLDGVYQRSLTGDTARDAYQFTWKGHNEFYPESKVVEHVTLQQAEFVTVVGGDVGTVVSRFLFWGNMGFYELDFDIYAFDRLSFSNLMIELQFPANNPPAQTFAFEAGQMSLDAGTSQMRTGSVPSHFPLAIQGMMQSGSDASKGQAASPSAAGFITVQSPLPASALGPVWWGLTYSLDLGSPGALAARAGFKATVLAAWAPDTGESAESLIGMQLPGSTGSSAQVTIEGPLKLAMSSIQFAAAANGGAPYVLRFNDMALKFLSLSLPTSGTTNVYLFGDPSKPNSKTLGWYAAYQKDASKPDGNGGAGGNNALEHTPPVQLPKGSGDS